MKNRLFTLLFFFSLFLNAQITIEGYVLSNNKRLPLEYVNVAFQSKNIGVSTNSKGFFSIELKEAYLSDSLLVSYLGYTTQKIALTTFLSNVNKTIVLLKDNTILDEVFLEIKKYKYTATKTLGEKKKLFQYGNSVPFGYENAIFIENKKKRAGKIEAVKILFKQQESKIYDVHSAYFQIKFYKRDPLIMAPNKLLSSKKIIIKPVNKTQVFNLDVSKFNILLPKEGVFVSITPVNPNLEKPKTIMYVIAPIIKWTYADSALTYSSFRGKPWRLKQTKLKSKMPFSKQKESFSNPRISIKVKYIKD